MLALTIDGRALIAWLALLVVVMFVVVIAARLVRREQSVRSTRIGLFVERERFDDPDIESGFDDDTSSEDDITQVVRHSYPDDLYRR